MVDHAYYDVLLSVWVVFASAPGVPLFDVGYLSGYRRLCAPQNPVSGKPKGCETRAIASLGRAGGIMRQASTCR